MHSKNIREEEHKNRIGEKYFANFDYKKLSVILISVKNYLENITIFYFNSNDTKI